MKIDDNYTIEADTASWNLLYEKEGDVNPKTGKPTISRDASYHATLGQALSWYLNEFPKDATSLQELLGRIQQAESNIKNFCDGIKKEHFPKKAKKAKEAA